MILQDSSLNRVLFAKDLPAYIKKISNYYQEIKNRAAPSSGELRAEFSRVAQVELKRIENKLSVW